MHFNHKKAMGIKEEITQLRKELPEGVKLVAVSKTKPVEAIRTAYETGQRIFGENKVQELCIKHDELPNDIEWHFIGHLQTNKVKYIASFISLLHAVDSMKLLKTINKEAQKHSRSINCLLQIYIAKETSKFGLLRSEAEAILDSDDFKALTNVKVTGLMGMATNSSDESIVRKEFTELKDFNDSLKKRHAYCRENFTELSMGMSHDKHLAIEAGSTLIRVGTQIFGERDYQNK